MSGQILDFPPPPANPTLNQIFTGPRGVQWIWDGQKWTAGGGAGGAGGSEFPDAPSDGTAYGRENADWVNVLPLAGGTMEGIILLQPGIPTNPLSAVTKQYVDETASLYGLYQGTWSVAANVPNIDLGAAIDSTNYLAITANPDVAEMAPTTVPGIGGTMVNNGDRIVWTSALQIWQRIPGDGLDLQIGDSRYLQLAGGTMTGDQYFTPASAIAFYDTHGYPGFLQVTQAADNLNWTTTDGGGGQINLLSIPMYTDNPTLTITPQVQFGNAVWLAGDPVALLQAATKQYVDSHIAAASGALQFVGTINGATGVCDFTVASNILPSPGPLPPAANFPNVFVVCDNPGVIPSGPAAGMALSVGDWVVSDGVFWNHIAIGSAGLIASDIALSPSILGATNVQQALQNITGTYLPLSGGTLTGHLFIASPNNIVVGGVAAPNNIGPSQIVSPYVICGWYGLNSYVNAPGQATYLNNGPAGVVYLDGGGNIQFLVAGAGVAGTPIPGWILPLYVQSNGGIQVGGGQNIGYPLSISVGSSGNANILMTVAGVRQWYCGLDSDAQFHIADLSAGTDRVIIGLDGRMNLFGPGVVYDDYGGHTFAFLWDGSFVQIVVDGGSQGQYAPIGFNDGRYLLFSGDSTPGQFTFGYVGCTGNTVTLGSASVGGNITASGGVAASGGQVWLTQYGIQFADWGGDIFSMHWDGRQVWDIVDDAVSLPVVQGDGSWRVHNLGMSSTLMYWNDSDGSTWYADTFRSDPRVKTHIRPADQFDSLAAIAAIPTHSFDRTDQPIHVPFGFLGNEIEAAIPDGVRIMPMLEGQPDGYHLNIESLLCHAYRALGQVEARLRALESRQ